MHSLSQRPSRWRHNARGIPTHTTLTSRRGINAVDIPAPRVHPALQPTRLVCRSTSPHRRDDVNRLETTDALRTVLSVACLRARLRIDPTFFTPVPHLSFSAGGRFAAGGATTLVAADDAVSIAILARIVWIPRIPGRRRWRRFGARGIGRRVTTIRVDRDTAVVAVLQNRLGRSGVAAGFVADGAVRVQSGAIVVHRRITALECDRCWSGRHGRLR